MQPVSSFLTFAAEYWQVALTATFAAAMLVVVATIRAAAEERGPLRPASAPAVGRVSVVDIAEQARARRIAADDAVWAEATGSRPVVVDPTRDVLAPDVLAHVAPGAGSVASVAATVVSTHLRTPEQQAALEAGWDLAFAEAPAQEAAAADRQLTAVFELRWTRMMEAFEALPGVSRAAAWLHYEHDLSDADCAHCLAAVEEISGEYKEIVGAYDTREWALVAFRGRRLVSA